jgi:hypothetical protein
MISVALVTSSLLSRLLAAKPATLSKMECRLRGVTNHGVLAVQMPALAVAECDEHWPLNETPLVHKADITGRLSLSPTRSMFRGVDSYQAIAKPCAEASQLPYLSFSNLRAAFLAQLSIRSDRRIFVKRLVLGV